MKTNLLFAVGITIALTVSRIARRLARHLTVLMKVNIVITCASLTGSWPIALQAQDFGNPCNSDADCPKGETCERFIPPDDTFCTRPPPPDTNLPPVCEQTCSPQSACNDTCNESCEVVIDQDRGTTTVTCEESTCGQSAVCQAPADCEFPCSPDEICVSGECVELPQEPPEQPPEQPPQQPSEQPPEQPPVQQPEQPPEPPEPPPTPDPEPPKPSRPPLQIGPANTNEVHRTIDTIEKESALNEARRHLEIELEEKFGNKVFKKITKITLYVVSGTELSLSDDDRAFISSQTGLPEGVLDTKLKNLFNPKIRVHGFHAKGIIVIALDKNIENGGYTLSNTLMHEVGHAVLPDRCANHPADDLVCGGVMVEYPSPGTRHQYTDQFVAEVVEKHNRQD